MNILTKEEIAKKLKCSVRTIDSHIKDGLLIPLPHPKGKGFGIPVLFSEDEVENFFTRKIPTCIESKQVAKPEVAK